MSILIPNILINKLIFQIENSDTNKPNTLNIWIQIINI